MKTEEQLMKYFIIITDTNSRQYLYEIKGSIEVVSPTTDFMITVEDPKLFELLQILKQEESFLIDNKAMFNAKHLVTIQFQAYPANEI